MTNSLGIALLGGFQIRVDGIVVGRPGTVRVQSLLGYLALYRERPWHRQHLASRLWPDTRDAQARTNLRNVLHQLRQDFPDVASALVTDDSCLTWEPTVALALDVDAFVGACREPAAQRAIECYSGDLLPDCYDEWVLEERDRLQRLYLGALSARIGELEQTQQWAAALYLTRRYVALNPLHEDAYRTWMRLAAMAGDRAGALQTYHTLEGLLQRELGVAPSSATLRLKRLLLNEGFDGWSVGRQGNDLETRRGIS